MAKPRDTILESHHQVHIDVSEVSVFQSATFNEERSRLLVLTASHTPISPPADERGLAQRYKCNWKRKNKQKTALKQADITNKDEFLVKILSLQLLLKVWMNI